MVFSHQSKTTTRQRQDNDKTKVEPVHSYDAFHTRHVGPDMSHGFNICLGVVLLWCENTITPSGGSKGGGGVWQGDHPPPWTCPDPENLCKVCVTGTDHPPPPGMLMTSHGQCPRGVCACECRSGGVCQFFVGWMMSRRQMSEGGGGACECSFTPPPPPPSGNPVSAPDTEWIF